MKTKIAALIITLTVIVCFASQEPDLPTSGTTTVSKNSAYYATGLTVTDASIGKEILSVTGISMIVLGDPSPYQLTRYAAPDKPEDVKIVLKTKDGKKWAAKWVEQP
jgi:hypothetical protein